MYHLSCSRNWDLWFHTIYFDIKFEKKNDDASNMIVSNSYDPYVIYELNSSKMQKNLALIPMEACLPNLNIWLHVASRNNLNETLFISCITLGVILLINLHQSLAQLSWGIIINHHFCVLKLIDRNQFVISQRFNENKHFDSQLQTTNYWNRQSIQKKKWN